MTMTGILHDQSADSTLMKNSLSKCQKLVKNDTHADAPIAMQ